MPLARVPGCSITRPIVIGNTAQHLGEKIVGDHTHKWTVAVKGVDGEDISIWVKKVIFKLHDTYANASRVVEEPPFEVHETGWGEFDIMIRIYFVPEANEKSLICYHHLKLHPYGKEINQEQSHMQPVSSWQFEEIVFQEPIETMYTLLTQHPIGSGRGIPNHSSQSNPYSRQTEQEECERLSSALEKVKEKTSEFVNQLKQYEPTKKALKVIK